MPSELAASKAGSVIATERLAGALRFRMQAGGAEQVGSRVAVQIIAGGLHSVDRIGQASGQGVELALDARESAGRAPAAVRPAVRRRWVEVMSLPWAKMCCTPEGSGWVESWKLCCPATRGVPFAVVRVIVLSLGITETSTSDES